MAFENIDCIAPAAPSKVPEDGVAVRSRTLRRKSGISQFITIIIGARLSRLISLTQPEHRLRVLFGTDSDAGKLQISVDEQTGKFRAKRNKKGCYLFTINAASAKGRFALDFPGFERKGIEALRPMNGKPPHFIFAASAEMLKVED